MAQEEILVNKEAIDKIVDRVTRAVLDKLEVEIGCLASSFIATEKNDGLMKDDYVKKLNSLPKFTEGFNCKDGDLVIYDKTNKTFKTLDLEQYKILTKREYNEILHNININKA